MFLPVLWGFCVWFSFWFASQFCGGSVFGFRFGMHYLFVLSSFAIVLTIKSGLAALL